MSTVDLKQVYHQIVTACNCQEENGFEQLMNSKLEDRIVTIACCQPLVKG
jgi:hypothetical protein